MKDNSKENFNRTKVNYGTYKETCSKLNEPEYKRGSKEKEEQIKRWETDKHIFKKSDNTFTQINADFKRQKEIDKEKREKKNTISVGNHTVFLGQGKYKLEKFINMEKLFLDFIYNSEARTKNGYINDFYSNCYLFNAMKDEDFKQKVNSSKSKQTAWNLFYEKSKYVFNQLLKSCKDGLSVWMAYYDNNNQELDFDACELAWRFAVEELGFKYIDFLTRIEELYDKVNEILVDNDINPIRRKETKYSVTDVKYYKNKGGNPFYLTDITALYEIIKLEVIRKIRKRSVVIGRSNDSRKLTAAEYKEAKAFIEEYVCYYDIVNGDKYYSVEDIPKTAFGQEVI